MSTVVFIGGSRHISRLNESVRIRLDKIIDKGLPVLVGDANGADKAVQQYLHSKKYPHVSVFCASGICRNNIGHWNLRNIPTKTHTRDAQFFSAKDRAMAEEANVGFMIWDGKSVGTLLNVYRLLHLGKNALVYSVPEKRFLEFKRSSEWDKFIATRDSNLRQKVAQRTTLEKPGKVEPAQTSLHI